MYINDYKYTEKRIPSRDLTLFHKLDRGDIDWRRVREDSVTFSTLLKFISSACVNHYMYVLRKISVTPTCVICFNKHTDSRFSLRNSGFRNCLLCVFFLKRWGWGVRVMWYHVQQLTTYIIQTYVWFNILILRTLIFSQNLFRTHRFGLLLQPPPVSLFSQNLISSHCITGRTSLSVRYGVTGEFYFLILLDVIPFCHFIVIQVANCRIRTET